MPFLFIREMQFKSSADLMKAMPAISGISACWNEIAPSMPFQISRSLVGHPLRIQWQTKTDNTDNFYRLFAQLQQNSEYRKHTETIAGCAEVSTLKDEIWQVFDGV